MNEQSPKELKEVMRRWLNGEARQWAALRENPPIWVDCRPEDVVWDTNHVIYRIKPNKKKVPLASSDFPAVCWLRANHRERTHHAVVAIGDRFMRIILSGGPCDIFFNDLRVDNWQYSSDLVNWHPCWKEVEA